MFLMRIGVELTYSANPLSIPELNGLKDASGEKDIDWSSLTFERRLRLIAVDQIDEWFDYVRTWIEVQTGQHLDHRSPVSPVHYPGATYSSYIDNEWVSRETVNVGNLSRNPATLEQLKLAIDRAGVYSEPPLEHILARDARTAFARRDFRRAAIDAGTAVERVLNRIYVENLVSVRHAALDRDRRNLSSLRDALADLNILFDASLEVVIDARNEAAHQGDAPSETDLQTCLEFMDKIIADHGSNLQ